jgi:proteic killer suppression protein
LKIRYSDKKLRELCERRAVAEKKLGASCGAQRRIRIGAQEASPPGTDLVAGNPHPLKGDRAGQFALDLAGGWRLVFAPDHEPCPTREQGGIDWSQVTIICIQFIGDYHD